MEHPSSGAIRRCATGAAVLGLALAGLSLACPSQAQTFSACVKISGTDDGVLQETAVAGAREALENTIAEWRRQNPHVNPVRTPERPEPNPYWRSSVSPDLYFKPDIVDAGSYTICWRGVVSPVVCTAGVRLCY